jgi:hypothetical protein
MALTDDQVAALETAKEDIQEWLSAEQELIDTQVEYLQRLPTSDLPSEAETAALDDAIALLEDLLSSE